MPLLKRAGLDVEELHKRYAFTKRGRVRCSSSEEEFNPLEEEGEEWVEEVQGGGFPCLYLGSVSVGGSGEVDRLGLGIDKVAWPPCATLPQVVQSGPRGQPALLQLREVELGLAHTSGQLVRRCRSPAPPQQPRFTFPSIASCGRLQVRPQFFGFISCPEGGGGDYMCHVFHRSAGAMETWAGVNASNFILNKAIRGSGCRGESPSVA